jgi:hypothetical protein
MIKLTLQLLLLSRLLTCFYDASLKGKEISVHNQTDKQFLLVDSLSGNYFKLYDTAMVNGRKNITRQPNYVTEYGYYNCFYSDPVLETVKIKKSNTLTLYLVEQANLHNDPKSVFAGRLYRSFNINVDTVKKYQLNHLFIMTDTIMLEHDFDYSTIRKIE